MARTKKIVSDKPERLYVGKCWAELFAKNAKAKKSARLTDEELTSEMESLFPEKAGKTTLTNVTWVRNAYNKGNSIFAKFGEPKVDSVRYDDEGNVAKGRKSSSDSDEDTKPAKKTAKKAAAKKAPQKPAEKPAKKTAKKSTAKAEKAPRRRSTKK